MFSFVYIDNNNYVEIYTLYIYNYMYTLTMYIPLCVRQREYSGQYNNNYLCLFCSVYTQVTRCGFH